MVSNSLALEEGAVENPPSVVPTNEWIVSYINCDFIRIKESHDFSELIMLPPSVFTPSFSLSRQEVSMHTEIHKSD